VLGKGFKEMVCISSLRSVTFEPKVYPPPAINMIESSTNAGALLHDGGVVVEDEVVVVVDVVEDIVVVDVLEDVVVVDVVEEVVFVG